MNERTAIPMVAYVVIEARKILMMGTWQANQPQTAPDMAMAKAVLL